MRVAGSRSSRDNHSSISASRASVWAMQGGESAWLRRPIIMLLFMVRPGTFVLAVVALGGIMPAARGDEPPCPSQTGQPAAAAGARAAAAPQAAKPAAAPRGT